jgi:CRISPR-associated protein Csb2
LAVADDHAMLAHYDIEDATSSRLWRTVTPAALPERAARRRLDPRRMHKEAKGSAERLRENGAAEAAVLQALRHAGIDALAQAIRVQREPFEARGARAETFASGTRFAKERLWHVEITFEQPMAGPLLIGDGRYLGLGLMAPVRSVDGVFAFAIMDGLTDQVEPLGLARALRRAVMARVQTEMGTNADLPVFFSGHMPDKTPARSGQHRHLAFAFDASRKRLMIVAPHILERREVAPNDRKWLSILDRALKGFRELRAGSAGKLALTACHSGVEGDRLLARSSIWKSLTPYRVTRHARLGDAAAALEANLLAECRRAGLPQPQIEITKTFAKSGTGLLGFAQLEFRTAVAGPILLGRDRHFGGGLFEAVK